MSISQVVPAVLVCAAQMFAQSAALVKLSVIATDSKGAPVTDLQASDVRIQEDGQLRQPVFFRFAGTSGPIPQPGPNEFLNRPGPPATVILLDRWNEREQTLASAWNDVAAAVGHAETVDRVYIYYLSNRCELIPVRPLPLGEADLRVPEPPTAAALVAKLNDVVRSSTGFRNVNNMDPAIRADMTMRALSLALWMKELAGPKNLIWVTHGFPIQLLSLSGQWVDYSGGLLDLAQKAGRARVAIYAVDQSAEGAGADIAGASRLTLEFLAQKTGGRWFASGQAADALAAVARDTRGRYDLAFYSPDVPARASGPKDHKTRIESARKGVHLLIRPGSTGDEPTSDPDENGDSVFTRLSHSPFEATDIGLRVAVSHKTPALHVDVHVDASDIFLQRRGDRFGGALAVKVALYRDGVFESAPPTIQLDLNLTQEQYDTARKNGITIPYDVAIADGIQQVRVMVFDRQIFGFGSVTIPAR